MKWNVFRSTGGSQGGVGLVDVLVGLAISSIIGLGASISTFQVLQQGTRNSDYTAASREAQNAIHWLSRDAQMAQSITGYEGFPESGDITITWWEWDNSSHEVVYSLQGDELVRSHAVDGGAPALMTVARDITGTGDNTTFEVITDNISLAIIRVTATVGNGARAVSVTKEREVIPRSGL